MSGEYMTRKACDRKHQQLLDAINTLNDRLYKDNGRRSIQSIINDHDRILRVLMWVVTVTGAAIILGVVGLIFGRITI